MIDPELRDDGGHADASDRTVRQFAVLCGLVLGVVAIREAGFREAATRGGFLAGAGLAIALTGVVRPRTIRPLFVAALFVTMPIGMIVSAAVLGIMYFLIITPLAVVFRLIRRDALFRRKQAGAPTYWVAKETPSDVRGYFRQS